LSEIIVQSADEVSKETYFVQNRRVLTSCWPVNHGNDDI